MYAMLRSTIKHSLGQFSIAPVLDFNRDSGFDTPYEYNKRFPVAPTIEVNSRFNPFRRENDKLGASMVNYQKDNTSSWESLYVGLKDPENDSGIGNIEYESDEVTGKLFEKETEESGQITFQLHNKYIISPIKSGMMIIHQHLAHQRVLYEELLKNITVQEAVSQQLLFPLNFSFSKGDTAILLKIREQLEHTGFVFSSLSDESIDICGIPVSLPESQVGVMLEQLITDIKDEVPDAGFSQNDLLVKSMAKSMAVKSGTSLNRREQEHLINQLFACKEPSISPNNKVILITMDVNDFDKKFM
jgi:DNA mismatch repair protein MutL